jgi:hypothetical protein
MRVQNTPFENTSAHSCRRALLPFDLVLGGNNGNVSYLSATRYLRNQAGQRGATRFMRVEDAEWVSDDTYYFTTTVIPRLYRVRFTDITQPELGGTIEMVINARPIRSRSTTSPPRSPTR